MLSNTLDAILVVAGMGLIGQVASTPDPSPVALPLPDPVAAPGSAQTSILPHDINHDLGINCRGSLYCGHSYTGLDGWFGSSENVIQEFKDALLFGNATHVQGGPIYDDSMWWGPNPVITNIACRTNLGSETGRNGICLFLQGNVTSEGVPGTLIKQKIVELLKHDCNPCGSVPLSNDNNPNTQGIMTANYVATVGCTDLTGKEGSVC